jgi:hypothetical protein
LAWRINSEKGNKKLEFCDSTRVFRVNLLDMPLAVERDEAYFFMFALYFVSRTSVREFFRHSRTEVRDTIKLNALIQKYGNINRRRNFEAPLFDLLPIFCLNYCGNLVGSPQFFLLGYHAIGVATRAFFLQKR